MYTIGKIISKNISLYEPSTKNFKLSTAFLTIHTLTADTRSMFTWYNHLYIKISTWNAHLSLSARRRGIVAWVPWGAAGRVHCGEAYEGPGLESVFRIHDVLVWIRIWRSMLLTNGSGSGPSYFRHWPSRCRQKTNFLTQFFPALRFRIRIGSGFNRVSGSGSGSRRPKMTHKSTKKFVKVHVLKCWMASFESWRLLL